MFIMLYFIDDNDRSNDNTTTNVLPYSHHLEIFQLVQYGLGLFRFDLHD